MTSTALVKDEFLVASDSQGLVRKLTLVAGREWTFISVSGLSGFTHNHRMFASSWHDSEMSLWPFVCEPGGEVRYPDDDEQFEMLLRSFDLEPLREVPPL